MRVWFFGCFEVHCGGKVVSLRRNSSVQSILKYLVINRPQPVSSDYLMGWLWPESSCKKARWSLNSSIYTLRKLLKSTLPPGTRTNLILQEQGYYFLDPAITLWVDKNEFESLYAQGHHLEKEQRGAEALLRYEAAIKLYRGDYLIEDLYEDWTMLERQRLSHLHLSALSSVAGYYARVQRYHESIQICYRLLQKDPDNENASALLQESYEGLSSQERALRVQATPH